MLDTPVIISPNQGGIAEKSFFGGMEKLKLYSKFGPDFKGYGLSRIKLHIFRENSRSSTDYFPDFTAKRVQNSSERFHYLCCSDFQSLVFELSINIVVAGHRKLFNPQCLGRPPKQVTVVQ